MANTISVSAGTSDTIRRGGACAASAKEVTSTKDTKDTKDTKARRTTKDTKGTKDQSFNWQDHQFKAGTPGFVSGFDLPV